MSDWKKIKEQEARKKQEEENAKVKMENAENEKVYPNNHPKDITYEFDTGRMLNQIKFGLLVGVSYGGMLGLCKYKIKVYS